MESATKRVEAMRCLVTGGTGMIGSHLVRLLLAQQCFVAVLLRVPRSAWRIADILPGVELIEGELGSIRRSADAICAFRPQIIFHLGWFGVVGCHRNDTRQISENLLGTLELLKVAAEVNCRRFVGLGSQAEYGPYDSVLTEESAPRPNTLYGIAKLCAGLVGERLSQTLGIEFTWLRLLSAYGPADQPDYLIPTVILCLLRSQKPRLSLGLQQWDYLYAEDVAEAIWQAALEPRALGVFNLASGRPATVRTIVENLRDLIDPKLPLSWGELRGAGQPIQSLTADISKFQRATSWVPRIQLPEGLRRTVEWFRKNQDRYDSQAVVARGAGTR